MNIIKNATEGIYPFQQALYDTSGFKRGEMMGLAGKSTMTIKVLKNRYYGKIGDTDFGKKLFWDPDSFVAPYTPKIPVNKHKFSRAKWYVAEYNEQDYQQVFAWCKEQFGPHPTRPDAWSRWRDRYEGKIHFRDERDYVFFTLKWA